MSPTYKPSTLGIKRRSLMIKIDVNIIVIIIVTIITITGFSIAIANYPNSESYPPWIHAQTAKPALIAIPVTNGTISNIAVLYDAYGNFLNNMTFVTSNSTYSLFSTDNFKIVPGYAYKVWVPQQNITYDFGLQPPSISQLKSQYYYITLNPNFRDVYWKPNQ
jgi:hypothetical protein